MISGHKTMYSTSHRMDDVKNTLTKDYLDINFYRLLRGLSHKEPDTFEEHCRRSLAFSGPFYLCCVTLLSSPAGKPSLPEGPGTALAAARRIEKKISLTAPSYRLIPRDDIIIHIVNLTAAEEKIPLMKGLSSLSLSVPRVSAVLGTGRCVKGLGHLWKSFSDGINAVERRDPMKTMQLIDADWINISYEINYTFKQENMIVTYLGRQDRNKITDLLKDIVLSNDGNNLSYKHMNILFSQLFDKAVRYAGEMGFTIQKIADEEEILLFNSDNIPICSTRDKLDRLIAIYKRVLQLTRPSGGVIPENTIALIIKYVEENYSKGLYLEDISSHLALSRNYTARIFKEETGESLVDYISLIQIRKAKALLLGTRISIEDIGRMVGIPNRVTFYRLFKRYEGISPSSFRKSVAI